MRADFQIVTPGIVLLGIGLVVVAPAAAQQWDRTGIKSLGVEFELPPNFIPSAQPSVNITYFAGPNGATLAVGGGDLENGFKSTIRQNRRQDEVEGWKITYDRLTANWASYSGIRGGMIRYVRAISICGGRVAVFVLDYNQSEKVAYDPVVTRMVRSMKSTKC